jgi:hypothetical protein
VPNPTVKIFTELLSKIGLLRTGTIQTVMGAYVLTEQYFDGLILLGGKLLPDMPEGRELVYLDAEHAKTVTAMNKVKARAVKDAIDALAPYLK